MAARPGQSRESPQLPPPRRAGRRARPGISSGGTEESRQQAAPPGPRDRRLPGGHLALELVAPGGQQSPVAADAAVPVGKRAAVGHGGGRLLQQAVGHDREPHEAAGELVAGGSGDGELAHQHRPLVIGHRELHERVLEVGQQHLVKDTFWDLHRLEAVVGPQGEPHALDPGHRHPQVETSFPIEHDVPADRRVAGATGGTDHLESQPLEPGVERWDSVRPRRDRDHRGWLAGGSAPRVTVSPERITRRRPKSAARTRGSIRQFRPITRPGGTVACLPTRVRPAYSRSGSVRFGRRSSPAPTTVPRPISQSLSTIARSRVAPWRTIVSNMTIESRTSAPASITTPGERTLCETLPWITQPWLIMLRSTRASGPMSAGARSSLLV